MTLNHILELRPPTHRKILAEFPFKCSLFCDVMLCFLLAFNVLHGVVRQRYYFPHNNRRENFRF